MEQRAPATTLLDATRAFEPFDLRPGTPEWSYYVTLDDYLGPEVRHATLRMARTLTQWAAGRASGRDGERPKLKLSGHKGTGKSTELRRLAEAVSAQFEVITCPLFDTLNIDDVDARDALFAVGVAVVDRVRNHGALGSLDGDPDAKEALALLRSGLPQVTVAEASVGFDLFKLVSARLRFDQGTRDSLRQFVSERPANVVGLVDVAIKLLEGIVERPVLLVLDDLDRVVHNAAHRDRLFGVDFPLLLRPRSAMVLTVPMDLHHDSSFTELHASGRNHVLRHVKLWKDRRSSERYEPGWSVLRSFVTRRAMPSLFAPAALDEALALSGGSFEQLRRLLHEACDSADARGSGTVERVDVAIAARELRADLVRLFGAQRHIEALERVRRDRTFQPPGDLEYLPMLAVMEYENDNPWYDVNPLLVDYVSERVKELRARADEQR